MSRGNPNLKLYGKETQFKKGEVKSAGRPISSYKTICERLGIDYKVRLTKKEKYELNEALLEMSAEQLEALSVDKRIPISIATIAKALLKALENGSMAIVETMNDRHFGKATQEVVTIRKEIEPTKDNLKEFSIEELSKMLRQKEVSN